MNQKIKMVNKLMQRKKKKRKSKSFKKINNQIWRNKSLKKKKKRAFNRKKKKIPCQQGRWWKLDALRPTPQNPKSAAAWNPSVFL